MPYIKERTQVINFFKDIIQKEQGIKIKSTFSIDYVSWSYQNRHRIYEQDSAYYILFEDMNCLVIYFGVIDKFSVEYRKITEKELLALKKDKIEDHFNREDAIYNSPFTNDKKETHFCFLEYGCLKDVKVLTVKSTTYETWINNEIKEFETSDETFYRVTLLMDNDKNINIEAEPAIYDSYMDIWSEESFDLIVPAK